MIIMSPSLGLQKLKLKICFSLHLRTVIREVAETLINDFLMPQPTRERENYCTTKDSVYSLLYNFLGMSPQAENARI